MKEHFILQPSKFRLDGGAMFGIIPRPLWQKVAPPDEKNRIDLALRLWLIKDKDRIALIDTGIGDYHDEKFNNRFDVRTDSSPLVKAIESIGVSPDEVTDIIISHLHFDHVGGLGDKNNEIIFKKANLYVHESHFEYSQNPTDRDAGSFQHKVFIPLIKQYEKLNQLTFIQGENGDLIEELNLKFKLSHGHTPFLMHPYDEKYFYMADLIPTSNHISIPWVMGYDISPGITTEDKKSILRFCLENKLKIIYEHDPLFWGSSLHETKKGIEADENISNQEKYSYSIQQ